MLEIYLKRKKSEKIKNRLKLIFLKGLEKSSNIFCFRLEFRKHEIQLVILYYYGWLLSGCPLNVPRYRRSAALLIKPERFQ